MRQCLLSFLLIVFCVTLLTPDANAARFGGGRSFGVQRSHSSLFSSRSSYNTPKNGFARGANTSRWGGMLGGLLVGGLLTSLFMGHGAGTGLLTWLMVGALIFFMVRAFKRHSPPAFHATQVNPSPRAFDPLAAGFTAQNHTPYTDYPAGFESESFLRAAKVTFIRLQAAYDQKNREDLMAFTTPDVFAEIVLQLDERGDTPNKTEVVELNAELLNVSQQTASVRFTGLIKENSDKPSSIDDIWHFRQYTPQGAWIVAGLQS